MDLGINKYISEIEKKDRFLYLVVLVSSVWFFTSAYEPKVSFLIALIMGIGFILYKNDEKTTDISNLNFELEHKLNALLEEENKPPPRNFHIEPDFITFFYSILDFRVYNRDSFVRAINTADTLLGLKKSLENDYKYTEEREMDSWQNFELLHYKVGIKKEKEEKSNITNHRQIFEHAESLAYKSLNYVHSFVVNLPVNKFYKNKHKNALKRYNLLVFRVLDDILHHSQEYSSSPELIGINYGKPKAYKEEINELNESFNYFYH